MASSGSNDLDLPITTKSLLDSKNLVHPARHIAPHTIATALDDGGRSEERHQGRMHGQDKSGRSHLAPQALATEGCREDKDILVRPILDYRKPLRGPGGLTGPQPSTTLARSQRRDSALCKIVWL